MATGRTLIDPNISDEDIINQLLKLHPDFDDLIKSIELPVGINLSMVIRYIIYAYDKNSYIALEYKNKFIIKKKNAALRARFPMIIIDNIQKFSKESEDIIFNRIASVLDIVLRYLYIQFDDEWLRLHVYTELYYKITSDLLKNKYEKPQELKIARQNELEIKEDIEKLNYKIFSGEEERTLVSMLYEDSYKKSLELRPEQIVTKRENNEKIVDIEPYGVGYEIDKMKFSGDN